MADLLYARYSSHAQDDGTSIEVQLEICERAAGCACRHYIDRARTGRSIHGRDALHRMIADAREGDTVWVHKWDRLGRDAGEAHIIIRDLEDKGVRVQAVGDGNDPLGRGVQLVVAEHYSRALAQRTRDGLLKVFERGEHIGGPATYGWKVVDAGGRRILAIEESEAAVIRRVIELYLRSGLGFRSIANQLNQDGFRTRAGGLWAMSSVRNLICQEQITGKVFFNRRAYRLNRETGKRVSRWKSDDQVISRVDESLRIISDEDWEAIRQRMAHRRTPGRAHNSIMIRPFTGLITCGVCGDRCIARKSSNKKGTYHYYVCGRRQRQGVTTCTNTATIREDLLLRRVQDTFGFLWEHAEEVIEQATAKAESMISEHRELLGSVRSELATIDHRISRLTDALVEAEGASRRALVRQLGELETRREEAHHRVMSVAEQANLTGRELARQIRRIFEEARESVVNVSSPAQVRDLVDQIMGPAILNADGRVETRPAFDAPCLIAGAGLEPATSGL